MGCLQSKRSKEENYDDDDDLIRERKPLMTLEQRELIKHRIEQQVKQNKNGRECKLVHQASQSTLSTSNTVNSLSSSSSPSSPSSPPPQRGAKPITISTTTPIEEEEGYDDDDDDDDISIDDDSVDGDDIDKPRINTKLQTAVVPHPKQPKEDNDNDDDNDDENDDVSPQLTEEEIRRKAKLHLGIQLLQNRLRGLQLQQISMLDDGNCQFRSIAHQLYGDADRYHHRVRISVVDYMKSHKSDFDCYFSKSSGSDSWDRYMRSMKHHGTWGDELTLRAVSNHFNSTIHVISSEQEHYYVCYRPDTTMNCDDVVNKKKKEKNATTPKKQQTTTKNETQKEMTTTTTTTKEVDDTTSLSTETPSSSSTTVGEENTPPPPPCKDIFLAYLSPLHYNSIQLIVPENQQQQQQQQAVTTTNVTWNITRNENDNDGDDDGLMEVDV